jgi:hypothetical protein
MHEQRQKNASEAWRIASDVNYCIAKIVGKFVAYPDVDREAFRRVHGAIRRGLRTSARERGVQDFCQELRAVISCPLTELLRPPCADGVDTRLAAIAQVVRDHSGLDDDLFGELIQGLLSWRRQDREVILDTLSGLIRR